MTLHQRIMKAAERGKGVRLSADEVFVLSQDEAICQAALMDDEADEREKESYTK